jgi:hypothetical protein
VTKNEKTELYKAELKDALENKALAIIYVHQRRPRGYGESRPSADQAYQVRTMLNANPSLTPQGYLKSIGVPGDTNSEANKEVVEKFLTVRSVLVVQSRRGR